MQLYVVMKVLVVLVMVVILTPAVTDGLVLNKCQLEKELNSTLPQNMQDEVAKIVCSVNLTSGFNTSVVNQIPAPRGDHKHHFPDHGPEHSAENQTDNHNARLPQSGLFVTPFIPPAHPRAGGPPGAWGRKPRSLEHRQGPFRPVPSFQPPSNSSFPHHNESHTHSNEGKKPEHQNDHRSHAGSVPDGRKPRSLKDSNEQDSRTHGPHHQNNKTFSSPSPKLGSHMMPKPTSRPIKPHARDSAPAAGGRKPRSNNQKNRNAESSEERRHLPNFNPFKQTVRPWSGKHDDESQEQSEQQSDEMWTQYGLLQLSDRVACVSGTKPSLNLCKINCDKLIDDDISDDIMCLETILLEQNNSTVPREDKELVEKMYHLLHHSDCSNVVNSQYFSDC
ncbi:uncharacterized protein [Hoplias malabaricus]|uniref:uncharacterized protein n=1 Tax=Hoplias malabaricus TaxID=27720 RepID=UPI003462D2BF